jgi:nucleoid-associated protein YgaU
MLSTVKKGKLEIVDAQGVKDTVVFTFNPSSYTIQTTPKYSEEAALGQDTPKQNFLHGGQRTLTTTLLFDSYSDFDGGGMQLTAVSPLSAGVENIIPPVYDKVSKLERAVHVDGTKHHPAMVTLHWGKLHFRGYITSFSAEYTMFSMEGKPIRARVNLTITEYVEPNVDSRKSPFESPDRTKSKVIVEGMSLWNIAYEEYGDCEKWRVIAKENHIMDPKELTPGTIIVIPAVPT